MNKRELIEKVAEKNGTSKVEAAKAVNAVIGAMAETLKKGEKISLLELGSFAIENVRNATVITRIARKTW